MAITFFILAIVIGAVLLTLLEYMAKVELCLSDLFCKKALTFYAVAYAIYWIKCHVYFG